MDPVNEARKRNHNAIDLVLKCTRQEQTIKTLVELVDKLRQPYNNSRHHDLYLEATNKLNELQDREEIT